MSTYIRKEMGAMKSFRFLSILLLAATAGSAVQAAEPPAAGAAGVNVFTWSDAASGPWQEERAAPPMVLPYMADGPASLHGGAAAAPAAALAGNRDFGLNTFLTTLNLPQAGYALPNHGGTAVAIKANPRLAGKHEQSKSIAEPASEVLMLVALASLAIAVRRRMPNERF